MSYLDVPRFHFAGKFIAKPSTLNNTPQNFDPSVTNPVPAWNPGGNHAWQFLHCRVTAAVDGSGRTLWQNEDPVVGAGVLSTDKPVPAKLVDLDTEQQMVSQIWGLQVKVAVSDSEYLVGDFGVVCFNDIFVRVVAGQPDSMFSAYYQSVLNNVTWGEGTSSPLLTALRSVSPAKLSIKFVVDGYDDDSNSSTFNQGRVVGTIGPAWDGEPPNFVAGRYLRPAGFNPQNPFGGTPLWFGPARVDARRGRVLVDLGNSIPTLSPGGPPLPNLGNLQVAIMTSPNPTVIGDYDYSQTAYETTAGVQEFPVTPEQVQTLKQTPLGVLQQGTPGSALLPGTSNPTPLLQENANGAYINATQQVYRMYPGDTQEVEVRAFKFGEPAAGQSVKVKFDNSLLVMQQPQPPAPPMPVGVPPSALKFPRSAKTGRDGRARFKLKAEDPGNPRVFVDGQVYGVGYSWSEEADPNFPPDPNNFVSVLVFNAYPQPTNPTWSDVQPVFAQYAKLYPFMTNLINLASYSEVVNNLSAIKGVLSLPPTDPRYMQVTRDMSPGKVSMILKWIELGAPPAPGTGPKSGASPKSGTH